MAKPVALRQLAINHYKNGKTVNQILESLDKGISKSTFYFWISQFKKHGRTLHSKSTCRKTTITTRKNKQKVKRLLNKNSGRFVSRCLGISQRSVVRICKELNLKVYFLKKIF